MESLFYGFAILACPVGMGLMMWLMMRGSKTDTSASASDSDAARQLAGLRAEVDRLTAERANRRS
ncbi:MAG: hypothetical protein ACRDU5_21515 [Mycobacterium sp.]